jgi:hypothetical protein
VNQQSSAWPFQSQPGAPQTQLPSPLNQPSFWCCAYSGLSLCTWLSTESMITRMPRLCADFTSVFRSASVPKRFCTSRPAVGQ